MRAVTFTAGAAAGAAAAIIVLAMAPAPASGPGDYALDRALIEDLLGRYALAVDFNDEDGYGALFAEDAVLVHGTGVEQGRQEIVSFMRGFAPAEDGLRPSRWQHNIVNLVLDVAPDGQTARGVAEWVQTGNDNPERRTELGYFGHSEDEYVKIDGRWHFAKREIFNEGIAARAAAGSDNPVRHIWAETTGSVTAE